LALLTPPPFEVIVVCDGCTDGTAELARRQGARVMEYPLRRGAAYARNVGAAAAQGNIFLFIDADCIAHSAVLSSTLEAMSAGERVIFGSYTRETRAAGFLTRFKNLQHHFTHQNGADYQTTFWSGCGAVTREAFEAIGGFDVNLQACEDIEFGSEAHRLGYRVRLIRGMQVEHLKQYTLAGLVRSDLFQRAIPWTRLIYSGRTGMGALNTNARGRVSVAATGVMLLALGASFVWPPAIAFAAGALLLVLMANGALLMLAVRELGWLQGAASAAVLVLHYFICGVGYAAGRALPKLPASRPANQEYAWTESETAQTYSAAPAKTSS
jgi:cellulose synthase/poly-beta-1,6-N-acetylglucosamine synthase-like glycosyltransferase